VHTERRYSKKCFSYVRGSGDSKRVDASKFRDIIFFHALGMFTAYLRKYKRHFNVERIRITLPEDLTRGPVS
jgi:hypothetical protein